MSPDTVSLLNVSMCFYLGVYVVRNIAILKTVRYTLGRSCSPTMLKHSSSYYMLTGNSIRSLYIPLHFICKENTTQYHNKGTIWATTAPHQLIITYVTNSCIMSPLYHGCVVWSNLMSSSRVDCSVEFEVELWVKLVLYHGSVSHQTAIRQLLQGYLA